MDFKKKKKVKEEMKSVVIKYWGGLNQKFLGLRICRRKTYHDNFQFLFPIYHYSEASGNSGFPIYCKSHSVNSQLNELDVAFYIDLSITCMILPVPD